MKRVRRHLTYGNIMATIACFVAIGGTSYAAVQLAANSVRSGHILDGTIRAQDLARGSITTSKVRDGTLQARDFAAGVLPPASAPSTSNTFVTSSVPTDGVMFFWRTSCPDGWTALASAEGRYLVGLQPGGDLGAVVGTELGNLENRPVGRHDHQTFSHTHTHPTGTLGSGEFHAMAGTDAWVLTDGPALTIGSTEVNVKHAGAVNGTNAPYLQLLACRKA